MINSFYRTTYTAAAVFALLIFISPNIFSQAPTVTSVSPNRQVLNAARNTPISVTFDMAVDPNTVNDSTFRVFGKQLGPITGTYSFSAGNTVATFTPTTQLNAGEWITVSLSRHIKSQGGTNMAKGFAWNFWTIALPGILNQPRIATLPVRKPGEGLIQCYGALGVDLNKDGRTDLAVVNEISKDFRIFLNNGTGYDTIFAIHPVPSGNYPSPSEAADFNHDGNVDIVIGNVANNVLSVFTATGSGNFAPGVSYTSGNFVRGVGVADLNGDGHDDIICANRGGNNITIFLNNGDGTFGTPTSINTVGNQETAIMMTDANNDGLMDAFVGCYISGEIVLLLGDGEGNLIFSSRSSLGGQPWAIAIGDINGDGNCDVSAALSSANKIGVIFGNGTGGLGTVANYNSGNFPLAMDIGDVDGDNDLDLIASCYGSGDYKVYENNGSGVFTNTPITLDAGSAGSCITVHDRDNDGDLDLAGIDEVDDLLFIFDNNPSIGINIISTEVPNDFNLEQNYPNPFNPTTNIQFEIPKASFVNLTIFDVTGKEIAVLNNSELIPGKYEAVWNANSLPSGVYFYRLTTAEFTLSKKMILTK